MPGPNRSAVTSLVPSVIVWLGMVVTATGQQAAWNPSTPAPVISGLTYRMLGGAPIDPGCQYCPDCQSWRSGDGSGGCQCDTPVWQRGVPMPEAAPWEPQPTPPSDALPAPGTLPAPVPETGNGLEPQATGELPNIPQTSPADEALNGLDSTANDLASLRSDLGTGQGLLADVRMLGDFFGGGGAPAVLIERVNTQLQAVGTVVGNTVIPGDPNATIAFNVLGSDTQVAAVDFFSVGPGIDTTGNGAADEFAISEPVPPTDAPTSPGPGFGFDGGLAQNPTGTYVDGDVWDVNYSYSRAVRIVIPNPSRGGLVVGKMKLAENGSPLPRNRLFFNYSYFDDVPLTGLGVGVSRFTPGFESTFWNQNASFEMRIPMASTADSQMFIDQIGQARNWELGDLFFTLKFLLVQTDRWAFSTGLSFTAPTADDLVVSVRNQSDLLRVQNQAAHIMPFVGWRQQPGERYFWQGILQLDADAAGYNILANNLGNGLQSVGRIHDVTMMYLDMGWYYMLRQSSSGRGITAIVPSVELHFNRSLGSTEAVTTGGLQVGRVDHDIQQLNGAIGTTFFLGNNKTVTLGYVNPLGNGVDRSFDGELRVLTNWDF
ncbi:MAG: hypothetical protein U0795_20815 [Pirellulales bacterium]